MLTVVYVLRYLLTKSTILLTLVNKSVDYSQVAEVHPPVYEYPLPVSSNMTAKTIHYQTFIKELISVTYDWRIV